MSKSSKLRGTLYRWRFPINIGLLILLSILFQAGMQSRSISLIALALATIFLVYGNMIGSLRDDQAHLALEKHVDSLRPEQDPKAAKLAKAIGLRWPATDSEIKTAARTMMKKYHPDLTGDQKMDMHKIAQIRDWLLSRPRTDPRVKIKPLVKLWRKKAGFTGQLWGALFPSEFLSLLRDKHGVILWPKNLRPLFKPLIRRQRIKTSQT